MIDIKCSNPYMSYKYAISTALGGKGSGRPVFKERKLFGFVFQDDVEEYDFEFDDLNYKYVSELPIADLTVFSDEDFGKFFYEYGRTILGNLMICLTKADWNSVSLNSSQEATYVTNYYNNLVIMDNHVEQVVNEFIRVGTDKESYGKFPFNPKYASEIITKYKEEVRGSRYSKDMCNSDIFYVAYVGLLFTLYGLFILFPNSGSSMDVLSFMRSPKSQSVLNVYKNILTKDYGDIDVKKKFITLAYTFYKTTDFLRLTSGLKDMDPFIGTMYDISEVFVSKLNTEDDEAADSVRNLIDPDIGDQSQVGSGLTIQSFTSIYDPVLDILSFRNGGIILNDNANIWSFGENYIRGYNYEIEEVTPDGTEYRTIAEELKPIMQCYLKASMKSQYTNEDIERAFKAVSNLVNLIDEDSLAGINPGFILQLTIMAAAFRVLDNRTTQRSNKAKCEINSAIDILDMLIYKLYNLWFKSGKFFKQPVRPRYGFSESCNETLSVLKCETDSIILNYLEFVRFGVNTYESDKTLLKTIKTNKILTNCCEHLNEFINSMFDNSDPDTFIRLCGSKQGRSIIQSVYADGTGCEFVSLVENCSKKDLTASFISSMAAEPEEHTGISILDRVIDSSLNAKSSAATNPEVYCIGIFGIIWVCLENTIKKHNTGNYFDFGNADNSLSSYKIEHVVTDKVAKPLRDKIDFVGL